MNALAEASIPDARKDCEQPIKTTGARIGASIGSLTRSPFLVTPTPTTFVSVTRSSASVSGSQVPSRRLKRQRVPPLCTNGR